MNMKALQTLNKIKNVLPDFLSKPGTSWWVEIITAKPNCIYYFGPFRTQKKRRLLTPAMLKILKAKQPRGLKSTLNAVNQTY